MEKSNSFYYKLFEKLNMIDNNGSLLDKAAKKAMIVYKFFTSAMNAVSVKKRMKGMEDKKYSRLFQFKDKHKDKRCFVICTGPSLTVDDVHKLKDEYTFGMNSIVKLFSKTEWRPTYYVISDALVYKYLKDDVNFKEQKNKFISSDIVKVEKISDEDIAYYVDGYGYFKHGHAIEFSDNAYTKVLAGGTVTYDVLQLAAYMGFKEIYLLGCDSDYNGPQKHFAEYLDKNSKLNGINFNISHFFESYKVAQRYCENHDTKIYNATRGGKLEVFPRVDFDSLFDENK